MFEYLKYLPLLGVAAKHPDLIQLFNRLLGEVQPAIPEIQQAVAEIEAILRNANRRQPNGNIKTKPEHGNGRRRGRRNRRKLHTATG